MAQPSLIQIRKIDAGRSYAPDRDIVWLFPRLMDAARQALEERHWDPYLAQVLGQHGVTERDVAEAYAAFSKAVAEIPCLVNTHPSDTLDTAGFFAGAPAAKMMVYARLGAAVFSVYHHYLRQSMLSVVDSVDHQRLLADMANAGERFAWDAREHSR